MALVNDGLLLVCIQADAAGHPEGPFAVVEQDDHHVRGDIGGNLLSYRLRQGFRVVLERFLGERPVEVDKEMTQGRFFAVLGHPGRDSLVHHALEGA